MFYSEEEQIGELSHLVKKYWKLVVFLIVLAIVVVLGMHFWKAHQHDNVVQSATLYQELSAKIESSGDATAIHSAQVYVKQHKDIYSVLFSMELAKYYVGQKQYTQAIQALQLGIAQSHFQDLTDIMQIRLARLFYQQNQLSEALSALKMVQGKSWQPLVDDVQANILMAQHNYAAAIKLYEAVLSSDLSNIEGVSQDLNLKINEAKYLEATINTSSNEKTSTVVAGSSQVKKGAATDTNTNQVIAPQAATSKVTTSQATTAQAATSKVTAKQATTAQAATSKVTAKQATTPQAATSKVTTSQATAAQAATSKVTTSQATAPQAATSKVTTSQATAAQATTSKVTTNQATTSKITTSETTTK